MRIKKAEVNLGKLEIMGSISWVLLHSKIKRKKLEISFLDN